VKRLLALTVGDERTASVRYRVSAHVPALEAAGFKVRVRFPVSAGGELGRLADLVRDSVRPASEDVLFVHRKTYPPPFSKYLAKRDRAFVFDMDDALDLPPPSRALDAASRDRYLKNFQATIRDADLVLCGNAELASKVPHGRTAIVPTPIDTIRFSPGAVTRAAGPTLGWVGHSDNLPYLAALAGPLRELARRHPALKLVVVADKPLTIPGITVEFRRWRLEDEVTCFNDLAAGLMPLDDTPWARAKCAFKAIQYMALGIPTVASPVGMNREVIRDGVNGFLPADDAGWVAALDALLVDANLSRRIATEGRATVLRDYALSVVSPKLIGLLEEVATGSRPTRLRGTGTGQPERAENEATNGPEHRGPLAPGEETRRS
jgi:glycosyltransferase involved in cell wall biosynthesis